MKEKIQTIIGIKKKGKDLYDYELTTQLNKISEIKQKKMLATCCQLNFEDVVVEDKGSRLGFRVSENKSTISHDDFGL